MTTKTVMIRDDLRAKLETIRSHYAAIGAKPMDRNLLEAAVARKALEALAAKLERIEADVRQNPDAWLDDAGYLASKLIDLI